MSASTNIQRRLIPRWRSLSRTIQVGELGTPPISLSGEVGSLNSDLEQKLFAWEKEPSVITAGEVVEASIVAGEETRAEAAAKYLIAGGEANAALVTLASLCLARAAPSFNGPWLPGGGKSIWRRRTRLYANNPLAWVELSLAEALSFRTREAERAMLVALSLAPENRHVLRAAARLFIHRNERDRAHAVLLRSLATKYDPWLVAAEIATASVAGEPIRRYREGLTMLADDAFSDWDISELAGALGTEELVGGRRKKARDLFRRSAINPSGNALAQMEWASPRLPVSSLEFPDPARIPEPDEAVALHYYRLGELGRVVAACELWASTEPYSIRPHEMASAMLAQHGNYEDAIRWAEAGLKIKPHGNWLLNNAAFAAASLDRFEDAERYLLKLSGDEAELRIASLANYGLIAIRSGHVEQGQQLYERAIAAYRSRGDNQLAAAATVFYSKASVDMGLLTAPALLKRAKEAIVNMDVPSLVFALEQAEMRHTLGSSPFVDITASLMSP